MPSGRVVVLLTEDALAVWGSSHQISADGTFYGQHKSAGAWNCSIFRNEGPHLSSELVREAVAATRSFWGDPPPSGMVTFVDAARVKPKRDPGRCFLRAGFHRIGETPTGLVVLRLDPADFPAAEPAIADAVFLFAPEPQRMRRSRTYIGGPIVEVGS